MVRISTVNGRNSIVDETKFTLIELIAVVAIIMILVSFLLPAIAKTRQTAIQHQCMNNLKEFGLAVAMYTDDYNGYLPNHDDSNTGTNWNRSVFLSREYYGNDFRILKCPDDETYQAPPEQTDPFLANVNEHYWSYCFNMRMVDQWPSLGAPSTANLNSFPQPNNTITYFEANEFDGGVENNGGDGPLDNPTMEPYLRHRLAAHYLYGDFRVGLKKPNDLTLQNFMPSLVP